MKPFQFKSIAMTCAASAVFFAASSVFAIGPDYQILSDNGNKAATAATITDVVDIGLSIGGAFAQDGTGTVIGATTIPINGTTSEAVLSILTANHVATSGPNLIQFGATSTGLPGLGGGLSGAFQTYTLVGPGNPGNRPEDVSIMQGLVIYPNNAVPAMLTNVINSIPAINTAFSTAATNNIGFTQIGYGQAGPWNNAAGTYT